MLKWLIRLLSLLLVLSIALVAAVLYVSPDERLDLAYADVPLHERAIDMAKRLSWEMTLTEADVNNLFKEALAADPNVAPGVLVTGARFRLSGGKLLADLNVRVRNTVNAALSIVYEVRWEQPNLILSAESVQVKDVGLPLALAPDRVVPLGGELPEAIRIAAVDPREGEIGVTFEKPSLRDLRELLAAGGTAPDAGLPDGS